MSQSGPPLRLPPREELVNVLEFEDAAKTKLTPPIFANIDGGDRSAFDRITFRPRMNVPTLELDLSVDLFGVQHFAPIIVGPVSEQRQYHPDAELATVRGAAAAKASVVISSRSSLPIEQIAEVAQTPLAYSVYAEAVAQKQIQRAVDAGCKVVFISRPATTARIDWKVVDQLRAASTVPVVVKGVMTADDAKAAVQRGIPGLVVSNHGIADGKQASPIEVLGSITELVGDRASVLIDGSFRRGSDILKALIVGAQGVLLARPAMWGLAAYGADGVRSVIELLQNDLARSMGMLGAPSLKSLNRSMIRVHSRL